MPFFKKTAHNRCSVALCAVLVPILTFSLGANLVTLGDQTLHFHDGKIVVDLLHAGCILWRNAVLLHDAVDDSRSCRFGTERHEAKHIGMLLVCNCDNQIVKAQNTF